MRISQVKVCVLYRLLLIVQSSHRADEERTLVRGIAGLGKSIGGLLVEPYVLYGIFSML